MKRSCWMLSAMLAIATAFVGAPARGADADILKAVPENAWGVLIVRNLGEFDQKLMGLSQQLQVPPMSVLSLAKATTGLMNGVNDDGSAAFVFLGGPAVMQGQWEQSMALIVPAANYADLTANMTPEDAGDGVSKVMFAGQESYIAQYGNYAVAGPMPAPVKAVLASEGGSGIGNGWSDHQRTRFSEDDITLFLNLKAVLNDPMISQMLQGIAAMSGGTFNPAELQENEAVAIGVRVSKDGVRLGMHGRVKPGSNSAKLISSVKPTSESLLSGLPADNYIIAAGIHGSEAVWEKYADTFSTAFANPMYAAQMGVPPDQLATFVTQVTDVIRGSRDVSFSFSALPEGSDGIIGMTKVATVSGGAAAKCEQIGGIIASLSSMVQDEEAKKALSHLKFTSDAETMGDVKVAHLKFHADQVDDVSEDDYREMQKVLGTEGVLFRIAALDDKHIIATLGGGSERFAKIIELAKGGSAPLGENAGIKKTSAMLAKERTGEGYLAADTLLKTVRRIDEAVGQSQSVPFEVPTVDAPIALVMGPVGENGFQADIAIPMAVISAAKDTAAAFQGGGPQANAGY